MLTHRIVDETDRLNHDQFTLMRKIEYEKKRLKDLDQRIRGVVEMAENKRKTLMTIQRQAWALQGEGAAPDENAGVTSGRVTQKRLAVLEKKLDMAQSKTSVLEYENRVLKEQIDGQRTTRWELVKARERVDREVASKERTFERMRRAVKVLEGQKAKLVRDVERRKLRLVQEIEAFSCAVTDMQAELSLSEDQQPGLSSRRDEQEKQLMHDIARAANPEDVQQQLRQLQQGSSAVLPADVQKLVDDSNRYFWTISKKNFEIGRLAQRKERIEKSMELVTEATAVDDVATVTALLSEAESENFALVHMMKDLNNEVERLQTEAKLLHEQLQSTQPVMAMTDRQALSKKEALEERVSRSKQEQERRKEEQRREEEVYGTVVLEAMLRLFRMIGHSKSHEVFARQVDSFGLTVANVSKFLGVMEERILQIIEVSNIFVKQSGPGSSEDPTRPTQPRVNARGDKASVSAPTRLPSCDDLEDLEEGSMAEAGTDPIQISQIKQAISQQGLPEFYTSPRLKKNASSSSSHSSQISSLSQSSNGRRKRRTGLKGRMDHSRRLSGTLNSTLGTLNSTVGSLPPS